MNHDTRFDVISAFLDNEPFSGDELLAALADPAGRTQLVDLVALRHLVNGQEPGAGKPAMPARRKRAIWLVPVAAAVVVAALSSGYLLGRRSTPPIAPTLTAPAGVAAAGLPPPAPEPTIVIRLEPGVNWDETKKGR